MEIKDSKEKLKEINNNKINNYEKILKEKIIEFEENEKEYEKNIKNFEEELSNKILKEKEKIKLNKNNKNEVLFEYQKYLNIKNNSIEKPSEFLINFNKYFNNKENNKGSLLKDNKKVYCFGRNDFGQLGLDNSNKITVPTEITFKFEVKKISISLNSTFIITGIFHYEFRK
jgi:alpha-tubulin suppressor-like RCC1 family protein